MSIPTSTLLSTGFGLAGTVCAEELQKIVLTSTYRSAPEIDHPFARVRQSGLSERTSPAPPAHYDRLRMEFRTSCAAVIQLP